MTNPAYSLDGNVALITMDDGKANALSFDMLSRISGALDDAAATGCHAGREQMARAAAAASDHRLVWVDIAWPPGRAVEPR